MLLSHRFHGRDLDLCPGYQKGSNKNQFTAVVGKNGSGKSRLLSELVRKSLTHSSFLLKARRITTRNNCSFDEPIRQIFIARLKGISSRLSLSWTQRTIQLKS